MTDEIRTDTDVEETPQPAGAQHSAPTLAGDWLEASRDATTEAIVNASGLPRNVQAHLRAQSYETPAELRSAIELQRDILADLNADQVVQVGGNPPRSSGISLGRAPLEQVEAAFEALMMGVSPPPGVAPLSGVREIALDPERRILAAGGYLTNRIQFIDLDRNEKIAEFALAPRTRGAHYSPRTQAFYFGTLKGAYRIESTGLAGRIKKGEDPRVPSPVLP